MIRIRQILAFDFDGTACAFINSIFNSQITANQSAKQQVAYAKAGAISAEVLAGNLIN